MSKLILCLDFDGVIHSYSSKWQGDTIIPDPVVPGFFAWAQEATEYFELVIYSSRSREQRGIDAMRNWLVLQFEMYCLQHHLEPFSDSEGPKHLKLKAKGYPVMHFKFAHEKPTAFLTIDDRAISFDGNWGNAELDPKKLVTFKPWNKK